MVFLDSSALVKLYVEEAGSDRVDALVSDQAHGDVMMSRLAIVEVASAMARRCRNGDIAPPDLDVAVGLLEEDVARRFTLVELSAGVMTRATSIARTAGLRAADAIQLASVLSVAGPRASGHNEVFFVSADRELNDAAAVEGLSVIDPAAA